MFSCSLNSFACGSEKSFTWKLKSPAKTKTYIGFQYKCGKGKSAVMVVQCSDRESLIRRAMPPPDDPLVEVGFGRGNECSE